MPDRTQLPPGFVWDPESISAYLDRETFAYMSEESAKEAKQEVAERAWKLYDEITAEARMEERARIVARLREQSERIGTNTVSGIQLLEEADATEAGE